MGEGPPPDFIAPSRQSVIFALLYYEFSPPWAKFSDPVGLGTYVKPRVSERRDVC